MQETQPIPAPPSAEEFNLAVRREASKQILLFAHYMAQDWELYGFDGPLVEGSDSVSKQGPSVEPVEGRDGSNSTQVDVMNCCPSLEPAPWEVDDGRLDGGMESQYPGSSPVAESATPSTEPAKEQQPKVRLMGNVVREPSYWPANGAKKALIRFPLAEHPEPGKTDYHSIYSTGPRAERIAGMNLQKGEAIRVTGEHHRQVKRDRRTKQPLTDADGVIREEQTIYAYGVKRVGKGDNANTTV